MSKNTNIININGKSYDAQTGNLLVGPDTKKHVVKTVKVASAAAVTRHPAKHASAHKAQGSKTLMRHAVRKPSDSLKRHLKVQSGQGGIAKHAAPGVISKASVYRVDDGRLKHAQKIAKSQLVTRFVPTSVNKTATHHAAQLAPQGARPIVSSHVSPATKPKTTADLLQQALDRATSHEQTFNTSPKGSGRSKHVARIGAVTASLLVIFAVFASQTYTSIRVHMASSKAGFAVSAPSYQPAGYSLSHLTYKTGSAGLHFTSNSDDRAFSITEQPSNWDTTTLRDLVVAPSGQQYQTIEAAGRTIFMGDNHDATWVDKGILYQVDTESGLNEQQLVKIANSL